MIDLSMIKDEENVKRVFNEITACDGHNLLFDFLSVGYRIGHSMDEEGATVYTLTRDKTEKPIILTIESLYDLVKNTLTENKGFDARHTGVDCVYKDSMGMFADVFDSDIKGMLGSISGTAHIQETHAVTLKTYAYELAKECAYAVFGPNPKQQVIFTLSDGTTTRTISGDELLKIACRFVKRDIEVTNKLGRAYFNKIEKRDGSAVLVAREGRFGSRTGKNAFPTSIPTLMAELKEFVPIGFSWNSLTPLYVANKGFMEELREQTYFGLDLVDVENVNLKNTQEQQGITYYTTRKRIHQCYKVSFDAYPYDFFNTTLYNTFINDKLCREGLVAYMKEERGREKIITKLDYLTLTDEEKEGYVEISEAEDDRKYEPYMMVVNKVLSSTAKYMIPTASDEEYNNLLFIGPHSMSLLPFNISGLKEVKSEYFDYVDRVEGEEE